MAAPPTPWLRRLPHRPDAQPRRPAAQQQFAPRPPAPPPALRPQAPVPGGLTRLDVAPVERTPAPARPAGPPPAAPELTLVPPPGVAGPVTLDRDEPVVRFDAAQSGIGVLAIRGARRIAWETVTGASGTLEADGTAAGDDVPVRGNRPLVARHDDAVVVALRHVRALRRLLVDAPANTAVLLAAQLGGTVRAADPGSRVRVSVFVVEGRLEVRSEYGLPGEWQPALDAMGWSPLASIPRARP